MYCKIPEPSILLNEEDTTVVWVQRLGETQLSQCSCPPSKNIYTGELLEQPATMEEGVD